MSLFLEDVIGPLSPEDLHEELDLPDTQAPTTKCTSFQIFKLFTFMFGGIIISLTTVVLIFALIHETPIEPIHSMINRNLKYYNLEDYKENRNYLFSNITFLNNKNIQRNQYYVSTDNECHFYLSLEELTDEFNANYSKHKLIYDPVKARDLYHSLLPNCTKHINDMSVCQKFCEKNTFLVVAIIAIIAKIAILFPFSYFIDKNNIDNLYFVDNKQ